MTTLRHHKEDEEKERHDRFLKAISEIAERRRKERTKWIPKIEPGMPLSKYLKKIFTSKDFWRGLGKEAAIYTSTFACYTALFCGIIYFMASRGGKIEDPILNQPIKIPQIPLAFPNAILFLSVILGATLTLTFPIDRIPDLFKRVGERIDLEYALKKEEEKSKS